MLVSPAFERGLEDGGTDVRDLALPVLTTPLM